MFSSNTHVCWSSSENEEQIFFKLIDVTTFASDLKNIPSVMIPHVTPCHSHGSSPVQLGGFRQAAFNAVIAVTSWSRNLVDASVVGENSKQTIKKEPICIGLAGPGQSKVFLSCCIDLEQDFAVGAN